MTTFQIPSPTGDTSDSIRWQRMARVGDLCAQYLGRRPSFSDDGTTITASFSPDLTPGEADTLRRVVRISGFGVITPSEYASIEQDVADLQAFVALASPSNAQAVAAVKSIIRVLGTIMRD